mmetsp:Transcript_4270/g.10713  ORF Transcript_4270/g.10713 Transcript_4270/m.10713 type:complete len:183 (+) Transcript_4270:340-888(+)
MGRQMMPSTPVRLNVYDLAEVNHSLYWCGLGAYHTGVEVYGVEYAFGGHSYDTSGLFATEPRQPPGTVKFRESIEMGSITLSPHEVQAVVASLSDEYRGSAYHLLNTNCNHFADDLCFQLTGKHAPSWINRLAGFATVLECILPRYCLPPLKPPSLEEEEAAVLMAEHAVAQVQAARQPPRA